MKSLLVGFAALWLLLRPLLRLAFWLLRLLLLLFLLLLAVEALGGCGAAPAVDGVEMQLLQSGVWRVDQGKATLEEEAPGAIVDALPEGGYLRLRVRITNHTPLTVLVSGDSWDWVHATIHGSDSEFRGDPRYEEYLPVEAFACIYVRDAAGNLYSDYGWPAPAEFGEHMLAPGESAEGDFLCLPPAGAEGLTLVLGYTDSLTREGFVAGTDPATFLPRIQTTPLP